MVLLQSEIAGGMLLIQIAGIIFLVMIIILGLMYFIRQENKGLPSKAKNGKDKLKV